MFPDAMPCITECPNCSFTGAFVWILVEEDNVRLFQSHCPNCHTIIYNTAQNLTEPHEPTNPTGIPIPIHQFQFQSDKPDSRLNLPEECRDFTVDEILHVLPTFEGGLPPEEVQVIKARWQNDNTTSSATPGLPTGETQNGIDSTTSPPPKVAKLEDSLSVINDSDNQRQGEAREKSSHDSTHAESELLPCSICLTDILGSSETIVKPSCSHYYHRTCLRKWIELDNYICTMCRRPFIAE